MHKYLSCAISRLPVLEANTILRVSERLPGLHPIHLYWFRTRMTGAPFAARRRPISAAVEIRIGGYFSRCHDPSQPRGGGFAFKLPTRFSRAIDGPSPGI